MIITDIQRQKHDENRFSVYIDGEFAFGIDGVDLLFYKLEAGKEVSAELLNEILDNNAYIKAKSVALRFLAYRMRSRKEVADRLKKEDLPQGVIDKTLSFLEEYGYIDDEAFAKAYISEKKRLKGFGKIRLKAELYQKGLSRELTESLEGLMEEGQDEEADAALFKKLKGAEIADRNEKQKVLGYLLRKGFDHETALGAIERYEKRSD